MQQNKNNVSFERVPKQTLIFADCFSLFHLWFVSIKQLDSDHFSLLMIVFNETSIFGGMNQACFARMMMMVVVKYWKLTNLFSPFIQSLIKKARLEV